jgi:hypothetical protein
VVIGASPQVAFATLQDHSEVSAIPDDRCSFRTSLILPI